MDKKIILNTYLKDLGISLLISIIIVGALSQQQEITIYMKLGLYYVIMCAYWGWKYLNLVQPKMFIVMSIFGWMLYFGIKFSISMLAGVFVFPYQTIKTILLLKK